jgi:DNA-binding IclR family transcriptional regulator
VTVSRLPAFLPERPETLTERILRHLATGRSTAREVACALGVTRVQVSSLLSKLATWGRISRDYTGTSRTHTLIAVYWLAS